MADDKSNVGGEDRTRVAGSEDYEVRHFAEQNGMRDDNGHLWVRLGNDHVFKRQLSRRETLNEGRIRTWLNEVG